MAVGGLRVAAGVIVGPGGDILVSRRSTASHQGGLWEFPGGKLETGEGAEQALARELQEELGIEVIRARPLIRIAHAYPDRAVVLHCFRVDEFTGKPLGREGQPVRWMAPDELPRLDFPAANLPIVAATRLPDRYLITPSPGPDLGAFLAGIDAAVERGVRLIQLRAPHLDEASLGHLAEQVLARLFSTRASLLLNASPALARSVGAGGVHLNAARLAALEERPLSRNSWVAASCHSAAELAYAEDLGLDFAVLSPVLPTPSHPGAATLGWDGFAALAQAARLPVYALGGVGPADLATAWQRGGQGIAAIRSLWPSP